ncbi:MAG: phosphotransferase family protein [Microthrixaceae bacterium]
MTAGLTDRPGLQTSGWSVVLPHHPSAQRTFDACDSRIGGSLDACVDRHELVHGDLLHHNVLLTPDADAVTAVFSWKCSTWGDSAYDLAWCTFWGRWHRGIGQLELWDTVVPELSPEQRTDIGVRHHAYELHVGATHLAWYSILGDTENLAWATRRLDEILERGPLRDPG